MSTNSLISDPVSIRSNQSGQLTKEQYSSLKSKLGVMPGWFTVGLIFALLAVTAILGQKILTRSTPLAIIALVAVIVVAFVITAFLGNLLGSLRVSLMHISIEQVRGQVTWNNNRYSAVANGRTLEPITDGLDLHPGAYTFSLLHGTHYILSAQNDGLPTDASGNPPAAPMDINSLKAMLGKPLDFDPRLEPERAAQHIAQLTQAFQNLKDTDTSGITPQDVHEMQSQLFGQAKQLVQGQSIVQSIKNLVGIAREAEHLTKPQWDNQEVAQVNNALEQVGIRNAKALNANQAGKQATSQRGYLLKNISSNLLWSGVFGVGWLLLSAFAVAHAKWTPLLAATGLYLFILVLLLSRARNELRDLLSGSVEVEEGWVSKYTRNSTSGNTSHTYHYYKLNGNNYEVWARAYDALVEGNYRLYILPATRSVVNIEAMGSS